MAESVTARGMAVSQEDERRHVREDAMMDDGFAFHISDKWAHCYPGVEVAVVTALEKPSVPPHGYVPLRLGVHNQFDDAQQVDVAVDDEMLGFSLDTLLWNEELLESRLEDLTSWTRREPLSLREKLDRINWLINTK